MNILSSCMFLMYSLIMSYSFIQHSAKFIEHLLTEQLGTWTVILTQFLFSRNSGVRKRNLLKEMAEKCMFALPSLQHPASLSCNLTIKSPLSKPFLNWKLQMFLDLLSSDPLLCMSQMSWCSPSPLGPSDSWANGWCGQFIILTSLNSWLQ